MGVMIDGVYRIEDDVAKAAGSAPAAPFAAGSARMNFPQVLTAITSMSPRTAPGRTVPCWLAISRIWTA